MFKTLVVLGMHRSATSLTAKALANEIDMGAEYRPISDQPAGNWENLEFIYLNDRILQRAGGSWDAPPDRLSILNAGQSRSIQESIQNLVGDFNSRKKHWGWKDPRTSLTIELYLPYLIQPHFVCNFRSPYEVALSLQKRNGFSLEKGYNLAREYDKRIINFLKLYNYGGPDE